jgi:hypothetical protein
VPVEVVAEVPVETAAVEISVASAPSAMTPPAPQPIPVPVVLDDVNETRKGIELTGGLGGIASNIGFVSDLFGGSFFDPSNTFTNVRTMILPAVSLDYVADNLVRIGEKMGIGLRAGLGFQLYDPEYDNVKFVDAHVLGKFDISLGNNLTIEIGAGVTLVVPFADMTADPILPFDASDINFFYGPVGQLNARYNLSSSLSLLMQIEARLLFSGAFVPLELTGLGRVGLGYRF